MLNFYKGIKKIRLSIITTACLLSTSILFITPNNNEPKEMNPDSNIAFKSFGVGRYNIDLPENTKLTKAYLEINHIPISVTPEYIKARAKLETKKTWSEIQEKNKNNKKAPATIENITGDSQLIKYNFTHIKGRKLDGSPMDKIVYSTLAYTWKDNMLFELGSDSTLNEDDEIKKLLSKINTESTLPSAQSLCYVNDCIMQDTGDDNVTIFFEFPDLPKLTATFRTIQYSGEPHLSLSEKSTIPSSTGFDAGEVAEWATKSDFTSRILQSEKRTLQKMAGEVLIEASTKKYEEKYLTQINAKWYYPGIPEVREKPEITIQLDYSYVTDQKPLNPAGFSENDESNSMTETEFMSIWERKLTSFSIR
ncbi:T6SS immunity protein Tli4 family protein [Pseudomonas syringae group genomosp. 3]|uniref:Tle cognate immunity protein 4 C-terminal domain-containing protein n=1 Tax=Pseudomonas syringae pv. primulae TaxID=251707 RepID=A0A3M3YLK6_9PSED|nr:T6SS immunity protein Tli4 family protein [Pseudomonas syringae group genomosp. 3]RMO82899.1 hypothetical protein ALQ36_03973 [Pseudomonas syringae pv. primulae]